MLAKLLTQIKKETKEASHQPQGSAQTNKDNLPNPQTALHPICSTHYSTLFQGLSKTAFPRVRYGVIPQIPPIFQKVLSCSVSSFNYLPHSHRRVKQIDLQTQLLPSYLLCLQPLLERELPTYNHILINVYPPGIGIMPHADGPMYVSKVVVLSLGGPAIISFFRQKQKKARVLLQDKSIHIFEEDAYTDYLHGIEDCGADFMFAFVEDGEIKRSSVVNLAESGLGRLLLKVAEKAESGQFEIEDGVFLRVLDNQEYNWKIEVRRKERISITIRERLGRPDII